MQIEKINNNKIKVVININDLEENHIDVNTFMSNSLEHQDLFLNILDLAEEKFDFYVNNSKLSIESISISNNIFIFTITKISMTYISDHNSIIYCFDNFDSIYNIYSYINSEKLYLFNNKFYLVVPNTYKYISIIEEFSNKKIELPFLESILIEHN